MKRRGFPSLLGAATVAPFLPSRVIDASAGYSRHKYGLAFLHARTRAHVSAAGIAYRLKVSAATADAMIAEMARGGLVTLMFSKPGTARAVSNILEPGVFASAEVQNAQRVRTYLPQGSATDRQEHAEYLPNWVTYLRDLCQREGFALHPRCPAG